MFFNRWKKIDESPLIKEALGAIPVYIKGHRITGTLSVEECSGEVLNVLEKSYLKAVGKRKSTALNEKERNELFSIVHRNEEMIRDTAKRKIHENNIRMKTKQINEVTARATIIGALEGSGYKIHLEFQCYRVKITILLPNGMAIGIPIKYKEINDGKIYQIVDSIKTLADSLTTMHRDVVVYNAKPSIQWTGWQQL